jgi:hypothetical protein
VGILPASFDPTGSNIAPVPTGPAPSNFQADIQAAYNAAPLFFQNQLCALDGIFVTADAQSWGYRNRTDGKRYIAISTSLWSGNPPKAITLDQYENRVLGPPLSWTSQIDPSPPTYLPATPNDATVLAALAHEFGHVLWADILISPPSTPPQSSRFCNAILSQAWIGGPQFVVWTPFENRDTNPANIPDDPNDLPLPGDPAPSEAKVLKMWDALRQNHVQRAHKILWRILAEGRPFPSLLGAFSANEQFVETFMLYTLMHANTPLTHLPLLVSTGSVRDIPDTISKRKRLSKVLQCF